MGVYAKLELDANRVIPLGLEHRQGKNLIKAEGVRLNKASELANYLPVVVIHQESQRVFTQSPKYRRGFIDWGVFHVEPRFLPTWQNFSRSLKQRNAALAQHGATTTIEYWDHQLQLSADLVDRFRAAYLNEFIALFNHYASELLSLDGEISIDYRRGWSEKETYQTVLTSSLDRDRVLGYTQKGPHRADVIFKLNGVPLHEYVSRGQQKLLVCTLYIAQAALYSKLADKRSLFLVDDVSAELDRHHVEKLMKILHELEAQIFITTPESLFLDRSLFPETKVFHVEHGQVSEVL